jgi:hypothetical protein
MCISLSRRRLDALVGTALLFVSVSLLGCSDLGYSGHLPRYNPDLIYLKSTPYDRLYVEVDWVEGSEPPQEMMEAMKRVLETHCDKPRGVRIARGKPIPVAEAKGKVDHRIALEHLDGLPKDFDDDKTAFLYALFYDSSCLDRKPQRAHAGGLFPCAIYFDLAYWRGYRRHFLRSVMVHELGHTLKLSKDTSHGDGAHCNNRYCAMGPAMAPGRTWLLGIRPPNLCDQYCQDCLDEMTVARKLPPDPRIRQWGPFFLRKEDGYTVGTLPFIVNLSLVEGTTKDWRISLRNAHTVCHRHADKVPPGGWLSVGDFPETAPTKKARLQQAATDPVESVRIIAKRCLRKLGE